MLDESPESQAALGLMLRLTEQCIAPADLDALDDCLIEGFAERFETSPLEATYLVDTLPDALATRGQGLTVEDICRALLSPVGRQNFEASQARRVSPEPEASRFGGTWHRYFSVWRSFVVEAWQDFLMLGSGARASVGPSAFVPTQGTATSPALDFTRSGKTGYLLALLYATSANRGERRAPPTRLQAVTTPTPSTQLALDGHARLIAPESSILDRLATMLDASLGHAAHLANAVGPMVVAASATLERLTSIPPLILPATEAAFLPPSQHVVVTNRPGVTLAPAMHDMPPSPAMQRLIDVARTWRNREASHEALYTLLSPLLTFAAPPSESTLLESLMRNASEFDGYDLNDLRLRRHAPIKNESQMQRVTYWRLPDAAQRIRSGELNITSADQGVSFAIAIETATGAIRETQPLMSSERFDALIQQWQTKCSARAAETWQVSYALASLAKSDLIDATATSLATSDLTLAYNNGLISDEARLLGYAALANISLADNPADAPFFSHRLEFTLQRDGRDHVVAPAGTCVIGEPSGNGTTLLYLKGDVAAWRAYRSPVALLSAIDEDASGLRTTLYDRLPLPLRQCAVTSSPTVKLVRKPDQLPLTVVTSTTLDVIAADGIHRRANPATGPRVAHYLQWLTGAGSDATSVGLHRFREQTLAASLPLPGRPIDISLRDIHKIGHIEVLRHDLSMAIPQMRQLARQHLSERLAALGIQPADPDEIFLRTRRREMRSLTDVFLHPAMQVDTVMSQPLLVHQKLGQFQVIRQPPSSEGEPGKPYVAQGVLGMQATEGLQRKLDIAADHFWETSRRDVRKVLKSEFIAQVWMHRAARDMPTDHTHIASRIAGPIKLGRLGDSELAHEIEDPDVVREWLTVSGKKTSLLSVSMTDRPHCLLLAPYPEGLRVYGFDDRERLSKWFDRQVQSETTRQRIAATLVAAPSDANTAWLATASLDEAGVHDTGPFDTFTAVAAAYEARQVHLSGRNSTDASRPLLQFMDTFAKIDLACGVGTWFLPSARAVSLAYSAADAAIGTAAMTVGFLDEDSELMKQGWHSLTSAIGAQGIAAARFKSMLLLTGDARYKYFVTQAPRASEAVIAGLHRTAGRFYAAIDADTRAYLTFDASTGFFRMAPADAKAVAGVDAPYMALLPGGRWHVVTQDEMLTPILDEQNIAWTIDQTFRARYDTWFRAHDPVYEAARSEAETVALPADTTPLPWQLRLRKLEYLDASVTDPAALGTLAGRVDALQNAVEAEELVSVSTLAKDARLMGARYLAITQRPRIYTGNVRRGLLRASALVPMRYQVDAIASAFNRRAQWPPEASAQFVSDLSELGSMSIDYLWTRSLSLGIATLDTLFDGPRDTVRAFEITAGTRQLLLGRRHRALGGIEYYFVDPAMGIVAHRDFGGLLKLVRAHLSACADEYELAREGTAYFVDTKEIDVTKLGKRRLSRTVPIRFALHL
ncbi:dermonecrotic toxin domain-containing protein [Pandoraea aquatica]|nr:DUF6543 domain-containing protein [Pandoraea aquatica]